MNPCFILNRSCELLAAQTTTEQLILEMILVIQKDTKETDS